MQATIDYPSVPINHFRIVNHYQNIRVLKSPNHRVHFARQPLVILVGEKYEIAVCHFKRICKIAIKP